jgi:lipoprotein-anchoring transpeptidase ErfK/SrfK
MTRVRASLLAATVATVVLAGSAPAFAAAPPTTVTGLTQRPGDSQVVLRWTNPADPDFAGVTVVESAGSTAPAAIADGTTVYKGTAATATVTGLVNGSAYSFSVFTRNTADETSAPASVTTTPVPALVTTLTATAAPGAVLYGGAVVLTGTLRREDTHEAVPSAAVDVYRKVYGQSVATKVATVKTNASGIATYSAVPTKQTVWYLDHPADPYVGPSTSGNLTTLVQTKILRHLSASVVPQNVAAVLNGTVQPSHAGKDIALQKWTSSGWQNAAYRQLSTYGHATFDIVTSVLGKRVFRLHMPGDADHLGNYSAKFSVTVVPRTLVAGMSGADVTAVQKRLAALHYDVGTINGYFGYDTVHATAAFQKVNHLTVNGTVDLATHQRLLSPVAPTLHYARAGTWVEADLTRQILVYGRDRAIVRILDISSGSGNLFTVDGETQRAVTPMGSFHIFHKIDGVRISRLGELWRPAYFAAGGYAIHGNGSVPFYPASHGCIRITISGMNRLFAMLTIGMPVFVYRS